eukprot:1144886-Pelagomonas_calceolata.AAC.4
MSTWACSSSAGGFCQSQWGGIAGRVAVESGRRRAWASRSMADNPPAPHPTCFWLSPRLAAPRLALRALWNRHRSVWPTEDQAENDGHPTN